MTSTLLELVQTKQYDELYKRLDPKNIIEPEKQEIRDMYMDGNWTCEVLTKVTEVRTDLDDEIEYIIGVSSKLGFLDIIRVLVYRCGFKPEGKYFTFDSKYTLSSLEAAIVFGQLDVIDLLVQCGTTNKNGGHSNLTIFEYAYMSRKLESMKRIVFWAHKLNMGVGSGDEWVRVHFRMIMGLPREELRVFSESSDSDLPRSTEKEIRLYMIEYLESDVFKK